MDIFKGFSVQQAGSPFYIAVCGLVYGLYGLISNKGKGKYRLII